MPVAEFELAILASDQPQTDALNHEITGTGSSYTVCSTRYQTRHFFNNFTTNEDIATKFEADYSTFLHFSHKELTPVQISLQYLHWR